MSDNLDFDILDSNESDFKELTKEEKEMGMVAHLLAFGGMVIPLSNIIGPIILMETKGKQSDYIRTHAKNSLNFQISMLIYFIISIVLCFILVGFLLLFALFIAGIVLPIIGAIRANNGERYKYPIAIPFLR